MIEYKDNYIVYEDGRVWSKQRNKFMKSQIAKNGYVVITLNKIPNYLHRIIAECFIPNPENKRTVNHIDGNKLNNAIDNLEWMTHSENHLHAYSNLNRKPNINYEHLRSWASKASKIRWSKVALQKNTG